MVTVTELVVPVEIAAPADVVWRTVTDWPTAAEISETVYSPTLAATG